MQRIGWILAVMIAVAWLVSEIPSQSTSLTDQAMVQTSWRRTIDGWENCSQWFLTDTTRRPDFHPLLLVSLQCTAVTFVAFFSYLANSTFKHKTKCRVGLNKNIFPDNNA
ncbi:MAG TPA: hypothetical protein VIH42_12200 [Thermoguttaceae bacterium]